MEEEGQEVLPSRFSGEVRAEIPVPYVLATTRKRVEAFGIRTPGADGQLGRARASAKHAEFTPRATTSTPRMGS